MGAFGGKAVIDGGTALRWVTIEGPQHYAVVDSTSVDETQALSKKRNAGPSSSVWGGERVGVGGRGRALSSRHPTSYSSPLLSGVFRDHHE